ncbi:MAG: glycoside hydrolase [Fluviicola sp.]|nr:glycoside hydrolase [Fluviicola sp.]
MKKTILSYLIISLFSALSFSQNKIAGVSLVSVKVELKASHIAPIKNISANWVSVVPFCDFDSINDAKLIYDKEWEYYGERLEGVRQMVKEIRKSGLSVMLKPQIREKDGRYVGDINFAKKKDWKTFEQSYKSYILAFVKLAEEENVELFCIGTELRKFVKSRPKFWKKLIKEIRAIYSGKMTYAANWDDYDEFPYWKELDFIGIDAYFPISKKDAPTSEELVEGWQAILAKMKTVSEENCKKILLTEYGYRSVKKSAAKPWVHTSDAVFDEDSQFNSLAALYAAVWKKEFIAGGFLWRWYPYHPNSGGENDIKYTVQNKLAEKLVGLTYKNDNN